MAYQKLPQSLTIVEAEAQGILIVGSCDWGGCAREAVGARWDPVLNEYLTVCGPCSRSKRLKEAVTATEET